VNGDPRANYPKDAYAGFWWRVLASLIDAVISMLILFVPAYLIYGLAIVTLLRPEATSIPFSANELIVGVLVANFVILIFNILYKTVCECSRLQGTLGKMAVGIKVTDIYGERISFPRSLVRTLPFYGATIVAVIGLFIGVPELENVFQLVGLISCIVVAVPPYKQGLHDMMAQSLVLRRSVVLTSVGEVFD
jgi:uncharacterized RDD family membrane protein YckC